MSPVAEHYFCSLPLSSHTRRYLWVDEIFIGFVRDSAPKDAQQHTRKSLLFHKATRWKLGLSSSSTAKFQCAAVCKRFSARICSSRHNRITRQIVNSFGRSTYAARQLARYFHHVRNSLWPHDGGGGGHSRIRYVLLDYHWILKTFHSRIRMLTDSMSIEFEYTQKWNLVGCAYFRELYAK